MISRNKNIDLLKTVAIILVVMIHVVQEIYPMTVESINSAGIASQVFQMTAYTLGRMGVPLFMMATGYLLLDREYTAVYTRRFWKRNLCGLLLTVEIWLLIYNIYLAMQSPETFAPLTIVRTMLFLQAVPFTHNPAWYLPMILGVYLFIPFVSRALRGIDEKLLKIPLLVVSIYLFTVPVAEALLTAMGKADLASQLDLQFSGGIYGVMLVLGYLQKKGCFAKIPAGILILTAAASMILIIYIQLFCYHHQVEYRIWYDCIFLLIPCVCLFELLGRIRIHAKGTVLKTVSLCSFGIYLIHKPILMTLINRIPVESPSQKTVVLTVLLFAISLLAVWMISRIPGVRTWLFFIKPVKGTGRQQRVRRDPNAQ